MQDVDLVVKEGEVVALVGQSGSGKSTLGRLLVRLEDPSSGQVLSEGRNVTAITGAELRKYRRRAQIIFQNPYESLDPRYTVAMSVGEPLALFGIGTRRERAERIRQALSDVGLTPVDRYLGSHPHELSGGQRQRVSIARALVVEPALIVADEPVSMLDASVRSGVMNLLLDIQQANGISCVFITHDLAAARHMSQRVAVMHAGRIVEQGPTDDLIANPQHEYTQKLIDAALVNEIGHQPSA
ncbi:ABC transporter ATP-binding protein [Phytoactinopolyspora alkaliphila]|uniref:ABC transporter ATP-binding protein n=1 Tax=Phytoactinopolyspora alkaliphila TaxID=1783498 RepID=A0A6N9YNT7_9ACTN|nr:ABC transporter ATP-binding protein [Phytoactinopolyspora alkaliphila]